jgi:hypothetical protein
MTKKKVKPKDNAPSKIYIPGPEEFNVPPSNFEEFIMLIYGMKSIGKSTLASEAKNSLTLMSEPLRRGISIRMNQLHMYTAKEIMEGAQDTYQLVANTITDIIENATIKTLVFDSIDLFYDMVVHSVSARNGVDSPGKAGKSSADVWIEVKTEFKQFMDSLAQSRLGIILLSHAKEREIEAIDGSMLSMVSPSCAPACLQYIKQAVDFAFFYGYHESKRVMVIRDPYNFVWTGCGPQNRFLQPDGKPVFRLEMPNSPGTAYKTLVEAFNNQHWDMDTPEESRTKSVVPRKKGVR